MTVSLKAQQLFFFLIIPLKVYINDLKDIYTYFFFQKFNIFMIIVKMSTVKKFVNLRYIKMLKDGLKILNLTPVK